MEKESNHGEVLLGDLSMGGWSHSQSVKRIDRLTNHPTNIIIVSFHSHEQHEWPTLLHRILSLVLLCTTAFSVIHFGSSSAPYLCPNIIELNAKLDYIDSPVRILVPFFSPEWIPHNNVLHNNVFLLLRKYRTLTFNHPMTPFDPKLIQIYRVNRSVGGGLSND